MMLNMVSKCLLRRWLILCLFPIASQIVLLPAGAVVIENLSAVQDNTLYERAYGISGSTLSNGSGEHLFSGATADLDQHGVRRALIAFDIAAAIPAGASIETVSLTMNVSRSTTGDLPFDLHRLLSDWGEGDSDAPSPEGQGATAEPGDATWTHTFSPGDNWTTAGGDFDPVASSSQLIGFGGFYTWPSTPALVDDVQYWLDNPGSDFGWMILGDEEQTSAKRFDSRENPELANRPLLSIEYTPVPEPSAFLLIALAILGILTPLRLVRSVQG